MKNSSANLRSIFIWLIISLECVKKLGISLYDRESRMFHHLQLKWETIYNNKTYNNSKQHWKASGRGLWLQSQLQFNMYYTLHYTLLSSDKSSTVTVYYISFCCLYWLLFFIVCFFKVLFDSLVAADKSPDQIWRPRLWCRELAVCSQRVFIGWELCLCEVCPGKEGYYCSIVCTFSDGKLFRKNS